MQRKGLDMIKLALSKNKGSSQEVGSASDMVALNAGCSTFMPPVLPIIWPRV